MSVKTQCRTEDVFRILSRSVCITKFLNEGIIIIIVIRITLLRPCVYEGYWVTTTTAEDEMVKCEGLGEYDTVLIRY